MKDYEYKLAHLSGEIGRTLLTINDTEERKKACKTVALMIATYVPSSAEEAYKEAIDELPSILKDDIITTLTLLSICTKGKDKDE